MEDSDSLILPRSSSPSPPNSRQRSFMLPDLNLQLKMRKTFSTRFSIKVRRYKTKQPKTSKDVTFANDKKQTQDEIRLERLAHRPKVTAQSWVVMGGKKEKVFDGKDIDNPREVASLTKIMTCFVVLNELSFHKINLSEKIQVSKNAASMQGTSALLQSGDELTIIDMLHGMMLPSGNDAATALAEYVGSIIDPQSVDYIRTFIKKMNETCKLYKLNSTCFTNPHGMSTSINISTARNIGILATVVSSNQQLMQIVNTQIYRCLIIKDNVKRDMI